MIVKKLYIVTRCVYDMVDKSCAYCGRQETKAITLNDDRMCNACEYVHKHDLIWSEENK